MFFKRFVSAIHLHPMSSDNTHFFLKSDSYDIFISYRRKTGRDTARLLQQTLKNRGYTVFFDFDSLRDDVFDERIENAIKSSKVFLLVMTEGVLDTCMDKDDWIRKEINFAKKYDTKIVPIAPSDKYWSFPQDLPWSDLKYLQVSTLDMGALFEASVDKIIQDRFPQIIIPPKSQMNIKSDSTIEAMASSRMGIDVPPGYMGSFKLIMLIAIIGVCIGILMLTNKTQTEKLPVAPAVPSEGNGNSLKMQKSSPSKTTTLDEQSEYLSKAFHLGILIYGKFAAIVNNKQQEYNNDEELKTLMSELKIPLSKDLLKEYEPSEDEILSKMLGDQKWADPNYIANALDKLYGPMSSDVFYFGFKFLPWGIKNEMRNNDIEKTKMIALMNKIALPEHFIKLIISIDIDDLAQCRDALLEYFKHHLEHIRECPNCHTHIANDYTKCPLCKTLLLAK